MKGEIRDRQSSYTNEGFFIRQLAYHSKAIAHKGELDFDVVGTVGGCDRPGFYESNGWTHEAIFEIFGFGSVGKP